EVVPVCQDWQRIAVASGNVRRIVNNRRWVDRYRETGRRTTIWNGAGLCENIDGLRSGDAVARKQWGASSTATGEIVPVCQGWQGIAVAGGNVRRIVNYWCWVDSHKETGLRRTVRRAAGLSVYIDGLRSDDAVAGEQWGPSPTAAGE